MFLKLCSSEKMICAMCFGNVLPHDPLSHFCVCSCQFVSQPVPVMLMGWLGVGFELCLFMLALVSYMFLVFDSPWCLSTSVRVERAQYAFLL